MQMKKRWLLLLLAAMLLLSACHAGDNTDADPISSPASDLPGFYSAGQSVQGNGTDGNADLTEIAVEQRNEEMRVLLYFEDVSSGEPALPSCTVELLDTPMRLRVSMPLAKCSAAGQDPEPLGTYQGLIMEQTDSKTVFYFQYSGEIAFQYEENASKGMITLTTNIAGSRTDTAYHLLMNYDRDAASLAASNKMYPAWCDDLSNLRYISAPYATLEEADAALNTLNDQIASSALDITAEVIPLSFGDFPPYEVEISRADLLAMAQLLGTDNVVVEPEIWGIDARFLCYLPNSESALFARPIQYLNNNGEAETYDQLWQFAPDGSRSQYMEGDFSTVSEAQFSKDGAHLALLESSSGRRTLYVYTIATDELTILSMEGFGDYTSSFCWGDDGKLYAMTGDDTIQLLSFDPSLPADGDTPRVTAVEEREGSFGKLAYLQNALYFVGDDSTIYRIDPTTGERQSFCDAEGFVPSPDGKYLACTYYSADVETDSQTGLSIVPVANAEAEIEIPNDKALMSVCWSEDGQWLYYLVLNDISDNYPCSLHRYNVQTLQTERLGSLASTSIAPAKGEAVLVTAYYDRGGVSMPLTFVLSLAK